MNNIRISRMMYEYIRAGRRKMQWPRKDKVAGSVEEGIKK